MVAELRDERCDASLVFVTRCREHYEAMDAVKMLRQDILDWEAAGMPVNFAEIKKMGSFNKLSAYTHLFKKQALDNFLALASKDDDFMDEHKATSAEVGDDHVDNSKGAVDLENYESDRENVEKNIIAKFIDRLDKFREHLEKSM